MTSGTATCGGPDETTSATALPLAVCEPAVGLWPITAPAATVLLDDCVIAPTVRVALVIAAVAAACVRPTTFGTATGGGPDETTSATALPLVVCEPPIGLWPRTTPAATVVLDAVVIPPTTRPAAVIASVAAACVRPTTFRTIGAAAAVPTSIPTAAAFPRPLAGA